MRNWIISFLVSKLGTWLAPLISGAIAFGVNWLTTIDPSMASHINQPSLVTFVWVAMMHVINWITNKYLTQDAKAIQTALVKAGANLKIDGWVGDQTVLAIESQSGIRVEKAIPVDPSKP